jgi:hypothetical protein
VYSLITVDDVVALVQRVKPKGGCTFDQVRSHFTYRLLSLTNQPIESDTLGRHVRTMLETLCDDAVIYQAEGKYLPL